MGQGGCLSKLRTAGIITSSVLMVFLLNPVLPAVAINVSTVWVDNAAIYWHLVFTGTRRSGDISGHIIRDGLGGVCLDAGPWPVSGVYSGRDFKYTATNPGDPDCVDWLTYSGQFATTRSASGTWVNSHGGSGTFTMTRVFPSLEGSADIIPSGSGSSPLVP